MRPTLVEVFGFKFHAYPTMLAVAFLVGTLLTVRDLQRRDPPVPGSTQGGLWAFLGSLVGAKVYWILQYSEPKYLWHAVLVWEGGLVFYGGLIGGIFALYLYLVINRLPRLIVADAAAPYLALGEAITRIGCFLNGCCWGKVTAVPWAVCFPRNSYAYKRQIEQLLIDPSATVSAPVHPTQLYMTVGLLVVIVLLRAGAKRRPRDGVIALLYCFCYGVLRFAIEAFRADSARPVFGMTVSQGISLVLAAVSLGVLLALKRWRQRPDAGQIRSDVGAEGVHVSDSAGS
jgi:phosphatidylglycerol:prolipoprotein diacylglycerol transferase